MQLKFMEDHFPFLSAFFFIISLIFKVLLAAIKAYNSAKLTQPEGDQLTKSPPKFEF